MESIFNNLNSVNVQEFIEKKGKLSYLTWSKAWEAVKSRYPSASYKIVKNEFGLPYFYDPATGYMVMTEVTVEGETLEMWLPVMDYNNKAMTSPSMTDINKTLMRCLAKNLAMFGLGLYVYAGQDLPTEEDVEDNKNFNAEKADKKKTEEIKNTKIEAKYVKGLEAKCETDGVDVKDILKRFKLEKLEDMNFGQYKELTQIWSKEILPSGK